MSNKTPKKNTTKNNKKLSENRKILTLKLDNGVKIPAKTTYIENNKCFEIDKIDIDKIRVSESRLYNKEHNSYKYYVFHEHDNEFIPLKTILIYVAGYYLDYKDNSKYDSKYNTKRMNSKLDDNSVDKIHYFFEHIEEY